MLWVPVSIVDNCCFPTEPVYGPCAQQINRHDNVVDGDKLTDKQDDFRAGIVYKRGDS